MFSHVNRKFTMGKSTSSDSSQTVVLNWPCQFLDIDQVMKKIYLCFSILYFNISGLYGIKIVSKFGIIQWKKGILYIEDRAIKGQASFSFFISWKTLHEVCFMRRKERDVIEGRVSFFFSWKPLHEVCLMWIKEQGHSWYTNKLSIRK